MRSWRPSAVVAALALAAATPVSAGAQGASAQRPAAADPGEVTRLFDAYAIVQAEEMLRLDDAVFPDFLRRLKTLQEVRRRAQRGRTLIIVDLQRRLRAGERDEAVLRERVDALARHDAAAAADVQKAVEAIDAILTVPQRARFRVFEHQMELRKLELLARARRQIRANRMRAP
jgi:hypothetical protein